MLRSRAPPVNPEDVVRFSPILKASWARVVKSMTWDSLGDLLYRTLFDEAEELRGMFFNLTQAQSIRFMDSLSTIVKFCNSPDVMHEKMEGMGPMHYSRGVQNDHMGIMGKVVIALLSACLKDEFSGEVTEAWLWLWDFLTRSMAKVLESYGGQASIIQDSWDHVTGRFPPLELGGLLYDTLFSLAPNLKPLFKQPRDVIALKFVEMVSTIVSFSLDKDKMRTTITALGFRHVRYGVRPHHIAIMGQVLMAVLERALSDQWTEDMSKAWSDLWQSTCELMKRAIDDGEQKGAAIIEAWAAVKRRTTAAGLGSLVYSRLLRYMQGSSPTDLVENLAAFHSGRDRAADRPGPSTASVGSGGGLNNSANDFERLGSTRSGGAMSGVDALGHELWTLLGLLVDHIYDPDEQAERLVVLGTHLAAMGLRSADLVPLGQALHDSAQDVLGDTATPASSEAIRWIWQIGCAPLGRALVSCEERHWDTIRDDWEHLKGAMEPIVIGETFYTELGEAAPDLMHLFARPKSLQAELFVAHFNILIGLAADPARLFDDIRGLSIRHVKYGTRPEDVGAFASAFIDAVSRLLGDRWSERSAAAWRSFWDLMGVCMARSVRAASSPITVALVQGDLAGLRRAVAAAPRSLREQWLLRIEINGAVASPLYWAIRDGQVALARFMLQDLLTIRADRDRYYYGLDALAAAHPDLVAVLCAECPALLEDYLDGLIWTSKSASTTSEGSIRVNYYIRDLYGDPRAEPDVWRTPLAALFLEGPLSAFLHPAVLKVLHIKWHLFGRTLFLLTEAWYMLVLLVFMLGFIGYRGQCDGGAATRGAAGVMALVTALAQVGTAVRQVRAGQVRTKEKAFGFRAALPHVLHNSWNVNRLLAMLLIAAAAAQDPCFHHGTADGAAAASGRRGKSGGAGAGGGTEAAVEVAVPDVLAALGAVLLWLGMLEVLTLSTRLSAFTYSIGMLVADLTRNMVVIGVLLLAFASALVIVQKESLAGGGSGSNFDTMDVAMLSLLRQCVTLNPPSLEGVGAFGTTALVVFMCLATIGMLNILIAQLSLTFETISRDTRAFAMAHRAQVCVEMEGFLLLRQRRALYDSLGFGEPLEFDRGDYGVAGGVSALESVWSVRADERYVPDRILRYPGEADKDSPWPDDEADAPDEI